MQRVGLHYTSIIFSFKIVLPKLLNVKEQWYDEKSIRPERAWSYSPDSLHKWSRVDAAVLG